MNSIDWLNQEEKTKASVGEYQGGVTLFLNEKPVAPMFMMSPWGEGEQTERGQRRIRGTAETGIHLYITQQFLDLKHYTMLWPGQNRYCYEDLDRNLQAIVANDREAHILIKMYVQAPLWWLQAHPEEEIRYADGYRADPNTVFCGAEQGRFASFASDRWLRDAGEMLRQLVLHLEEIPWGKRVIGINLLNGLCQEWHYWGSVFNHLPDISLPMRRSFSRYVKGVYGTDDALRRAWNLPDATLEDPPLPTIAQRDFASYGYFRDPEQERQIIDYYRCQHDVTYRAITHFAGIVKDASRGRLLAGCYYGYIFTCPWYPDGISMEVSRVLASPFVDFLASPATYEDYVSRGLGGDSLLRGLPESCKLHKKLYLSESDEGTYQCPQLYHPSEAFTGFEESVANLRKQFGQLLIRRVGNWWFDLDDDYGLFLHEPHKQELARLKKIADQAWEKELQPNPVALVYSLESLYYTQQSTYNAQCMRSHTYTYLDTIAHLLCRTGVAFDIITEKELALANCPDYKLYLFPNLFYADEEQRETIRRKLQQSGGTAVWMFAAGLVGESGIALENSRMLTGFPLEIDWTESTQRVQLNQAFRQRFPEASFPHSISSISLPSSSEDYAERYDEQDTLPCYGTGASLSPVLFVPESCGDSDDIRVWGWLMGTSDSRADQGASRRGGLAVKQEEGFLSVYSAGLVTSTELLRCLARMSGVPVWQKGDDVLLLNSRYFCLPVRDNAGEKELRLPAGSWIKNLITGERFLCEDGLFRFVSVPRTTYLFEYGSASQS